MKKGTSVGFWNRCNNDAAILAKVVRNHNRPLVNVNVERKVVETPTTQIPSSKRTHRLICRTNCRSYSDKGIVSKTFEENLAFAQQRNASLNPFHPETTVTSTATGTKAQLAMA